MTTRWTIRRRITVAIVAPMLCMLAIFLGLVGRTVDAHREAEVDEGLKARAAALAGHFAHGEDGWVVDFEGGPGPAPDVTRELASWRVQAIPEGTVLEESAGEVLVEVPTLPGPPERTENTWSRPLLVGMPKVETRVLDGAAYRLWTGAFLVRVERGDVEMLRGLPDDLEAPPTVQVSVLRDLTPVHTQRTLLLGQLLLVGLAGTALSVGLGRILTGQVIQPIERLARDAEAVRLPLGGAPLEPNGSKDELDRLTGTLNRAFLRVQDAYDRQSRFTGDASHELRTPLSVIRTEVEVALRVLDDPAEREPFESLLRQVERMQSTLEQLLYLARADTTAPASTLGSVSLDELADAVLDDIRVEAMRAGSALPELSVTGAEGVVVCGDRGALERVLANLVQNAIRYTEPAGSVQIVVASQSTRVIVQVRDTGVGIEPQHLDRVFERFYQVDPSRTGTHAGLGLSIVEALVISHGGTVHIDSEPGSGTTVTVVLPRASEGSRATN